jgi:hypothetical protein
VLHIAPSQQTDTRTTLGDWTWCLIAGVVIAFVVAGHGRSRDDAQPGSARLRSRALRHPG